MKSAAWANRIAECGVILDYTPELSAQGMSTRATAPTVGVSGQRVRQIVAEVASDLPPAEPESLDEYRQVMHRASPEPELLDEYRQVVPEVPPEPESLDEYRGRDLQVSHYGSSEPERIDPITGEVESLDEYRGRAGRCTDSVHL